MTLAYFAFADYLIFGLSLGLSVLTGVYFAYRDRRARSVDVYYHGNREMPAVPVGMSLAVSCLSAMAILGYPIECYLYGAVWFWMVLGVPLIVITTTAYVIPVYYDLQITCVYEYLEHRFNKTMRIFSSFMGMLYILIYMATAIYYPALSLTTVTPLSVNWTIFLTVAFCTLYTVIGGFKSVVWTDTLQSFLMLSGSMAFFFVLVSKVGGFSNLIEANVRGNRTTFMDLSLDPFKRCTSLGVLSLCYFSWMEVMIANQSFVQRYISCKSASTAKSALYISMLPIMLVVTFALLIGMGLYAYYEQCDPVLSGAVASKDEMLVYTLAITTKSLPGLNGLFVSAVYSGTLSTVSSGINSLTVMIMEDFIGMKWTFKDDYKKLKYSKICGVAMGFVILGLTFAISSLNGTIIEISMSLLSCFGACIAGIIMLGLFFPWTNTFGAIIGSGSGFILNTCLSLGYLFTDHPSETLPVSEDGCNSTIFNTNNTSPQSELIKEVESNDFFDISFTHTRFIAIAITIPIGLLASFLTGANDPKIMNPKLFVPLIDNKMFPEKFRKFMRFGVPDKDEYKRNANLKMEMEKLKRSMNEDKEVTSGHQATF